jgi:hypothetical protein
MCRETIAVYVAHDEEHVAVDLVCGQSQRADKCASLRDRRMFRVHLRGRTNVESGTSSMAWR